MIRQRVADERWHPEQVGRFLTGGRLGLTLALYRNPDGTIPATS